MLTLEKILEMALVGSQRMPVEIPNSGRDDLPGLFKNLGFKVGVEIGVLDGEYAEKLCQANAELKLYAIDPWERVGDYDDYNAKTLLRSYNNAKERLAKYNCEIVKKTSMEAVKDFADDHLDFVYIDGDHSFKTVVQDISEWLPKVKSGGFICGHDYKHYGNGRGRYGVVQAVNGFTDSYNIRPWFVLGRKNVEPGELREKSRSWLWIKQ